jgi:outer membrane protein assembly factor BamB
MATVVRSMLVLAAVGALFVLVEGEPDTERPRGQQRLTDALLVRLNAGDGLTSLTAGFGDVWASDYGREEVVRLDGRSGRVLARIPLGRRHALAAGGGSVWALRWGGRFYRRPDGPLYRIDPATNRIADRIPLRSPSGRPVFGFGVLHGASALWVWGPDRVLLLDPSTGRLTQELEVDRRHGELTSAVVDQDGLLALHADGRLVRFDDGGAHARAQAAALRGAELLAADGPRALAATAGTLLAADTETGRVDWRRTLGFRVSTVLESGGVLLAHGARFHDPGDRVWALDPATGRTLATTIVPSFGTTSMTTSGGALWLSTGAGELIVVPPLLNRLFLARAT